MRKKYDAQFLIGIVQRAEEVYIPDGSFELKQGDKIAIIAPPNEMHRLLKMIKSLKKQARNVIILGASRTSYYLAKMLINSGNTVKVIEKDKQRCVEFCESLPDAVVIQGDGAFQELLLEEGIRSTDAFVALTGMDEENILVSFYAMSQNVPKVISKVNRDELSQMAEKLGLDCIVSPQKTISDVLARYARALHNSIGSKVEALYNMMDGKAEALEFNVLADFPWTNIPLKDMKLKSNTLIAAIIRGRKAMIPTGNDRILSGDKVIVIAANKHLRDLSDIMQ
ncbi:MAG: NAD-binding protein, partial [Clostridia bacterium]|nr:NAD-binding protein [Clostridia bacterium]